MRIALKRAYYIEVDRDNLVSSCDAVADELKFSDLVGDVW